MCLLLCQHEEVDDKLLKNNVLYTAFLSVIFLCRTLKFIVVYKSITHLVYFSVIVTVYQFTV